MLRSMFWPPLVVTVLCFGAACSSEPEAPPPAPAGAPSESPAEDPGPEADKPEEAEEVKEAAPEPVEIVASLGTVSGKVLVNKKPGAAGQKLAQGDEIQTKRKGQADVFMTDGSRVRLGPNSKLKLEALGDKGVSVSLLLGRLYSLISPGTPYEVKTSNAVAGVRGTKFYVEAKKKKSYVCVCEGAVAVKPLGDGEETVLNAGEELSLTKKKTSPKKESQVQMVDSFNAVFDELEALPDPE